MRAFSEALRYHGTYIKVDIIPQKQATAQLQQVSPYISGLSIGTSSTNKEVIVRAPPSYEHLMGLPTVPDREETKESLFFDHSGHGGGQICALTPYWDVRANLTLFSEKDKTHLPLRDKPLLLWHNLEQHLGRLDKDAEISLAITGFHLCWSRDSQTYHLRFDGNCSFLIMQEFGERTSGLLREAFREVCDKVRLLLEEKNE